MHRALSLLPLLLLATATARADEWRFQMSDGTETRVRWVDSMSVDTLYGSLERSSLTLPMASIIGVRRVRTGTGTGALLGAGIGAATALVWSALEAGKPCSGHPCFNGSLILLVIGTPIFGATGAIIGTVAGSLDADAEQATFPPGAPAGHKIAVIRHLDE